MGEFRTWGGLLVNVDLFSLSVVSEGYLVTRLEVQLAIGRNSFVFLPQGMGIGVYVFELVLDWGRWELCAFK